MRKKKSCELKSHSEAVMRPSLSLNPDCALGGGGVEIVENLFHGLLKADKGQHALLS